MFEKNETQTPKKETKEKAVTKVTKEDAMSETTNNKANKKVDEKTQGSDRAIVNQEQLDTMEGAVALEKIREYLLAIPKEKIRRLYTKAIQAIEIGLAYVQAFAMDKGLFEKTFRKEVFDANDYKNLELRVMAFWYADIMLRQVVGKDDPLKNLLSSAVPLKTKMLRSAVYLWENNENLGEIVANIKAGRGYANTADDLNSLAHLFTQHWNQVKLMCNVTVEDISLAQELSTSILRLKNAKEEVAKIEQLQDIRDRAGEYLRQGIEEIRAGAAYIFRNDPDALTRYPSLFIKQRKKKTNGRKNGDSPVESTGSLQASKLMVVQAETQPTSHQALLEQTEEMTGTH